MTLISEITTEETSALSENDLFVGEQNDGTNFKVQWSIMRQSLHVYPAGYMINGKLAVSVASNNLTVALKTLADGDPSTSDPVFVRIGDAEHKVTAALSVTKNAGTNWCNAGGTGLATQTIGYFAYLGYNATDGVVIGFSRISYATRYDDFSATTTEGKYAAISTITTAGASDAYENVGYFHAILSAGAGYTWSLPATTVTVSRPTVESRWLAYAPSLTGYSSAPTDTSYRYKFNGRTVTVVMSEATAGTSNATSKTYTLPISASTITNASWRTAIPALVDNGTIEATGTALVGSGSATVSMYRSALANWTGSGSARIIGCIFSYEIG